MTDPKEVDLALGAFDADRKHTRPLLMKWALATVAVQDLVKERTDKTPSWPAIASAAVRWLDDYGRRSGSWKSEQELTLRLSRAEGEPDLADANPFERFDIRVSLWMQRYGVLLLRLSLGVVFVWFGVLKPLGLSPAAELVRNTVTWFDFDVFFPILGVWEVAIGLCLIFRPLLRLALLLLFLQMPGTALPLVLLPDVCFTQFPHALTLEGQYIIKNLTLISAGIVVGGTVRFGTKRKDQKRVTWVV